MLILRLLLANFKSHSIRSALTVLAIALSVSLVVAVTSGYVSIEGSYIKYFSEFVGATDFQIRKDTEHDGGLYSAEVQNAISKDPRVQRAVGRIPHRAGITRVSPGTTSPAQDPDTDPFLPQITGIDSQYDMDILNLKLDAGRWFEKGEADAIILDQVAASAIGAKVGDKVTIDSKIPNLLTLIGIVHKPDIIANFVRSGYVPLDTMRKITSNPDTVSVIRVTLQPGADFDVFLNDWTAKLPTFDPNLKISSTREMRKQINAQMANLQFVSFLGGAISMVAAAFIIFSTLSMGVLERARSLAMLRAVGLLRIQLGTMVLAEGAILSGAGIALGIPIGVGWIFLLTQWKADLFSAGMIFSPGGMAFAAGGSIATALLAGLLPAWSACRIKPIDALADVARPTRKRTPFIAAAAGLVLIAFDPFFAFMPHLSPTVRFYGHFVLGLPLLMMGFFFFSPLLIITVEKVCSPVVAWILRIQPGLLKRQLSQHQWRAAGTSSALMVGLAILIVMHVIGATIMASFEIPDRFPDIFLYVQRPGYLTLEQVKQLDTIPGIKRGEYMPIGITIPQLPKGTFSGKVSLAAAALIPDATMLLAIDPDKCFKMMDLKFLEGDPKTAAEKLKTGRYVVVTDEFRRINDTHIGSKIKLKKGLLLAKEFEYEVVGVVWCPGVEVFVSVFDMHRQFGDRAAATVFASLNQAKTDFDVDAYEIIAANLEIGQDKKKLEADMKEKFGLSIQAGDVRQIKYGIEKGYARSMLVLSVLALAAIVVASLGVTNAVMASIRSRRWTLGILRSIGLTQTHLLRLIFAESLLLAICACIIGISAGLLICVDAMGYMATLLGFSAKLQLPPDIFIKGILIVLGVSILASLIPAIMAAREKPLSLLQSGRSGT